MPAIENCLRFHIGNVKGAERRLGMANRHNDSSLRLSILCSVFVKSAAPNNYRETKKMKDTVGFAEAMQYCGLEIEDDESMKIFIEAVRLAAPAFKDFGDLPEGDDKAGVHILQWDAIKDAVKAEVKILLQGDDIMNDTVTLEEAMQYCGFSDEQHQL